MYGFRWERWSALAGVLFVALFMIGLAISGETGSTPEEVQRFYADDGNQAQTFASYFFLVAAGLAFLSFLGTLRAMLVRAEGGPGTLSALVFGPGVVFVALMVAAASAFVAPAALADDSDFALDPNTAEILSNLGYLTFVAGVMVASILVLSTSTAALRTGVLPAWLGWAGLVVAVAMLFAVFFIPIFVFMAWVLAVSLVMVVAPWRVRAPAEAQPTTVVG